MGIIAVIFLNNFSLFFPFALSAGQGFLYEVGIFEHLYKNTTFGFVLNI